MAAHEQDLVHCIKVRIGVQGVHDLSESLPLSRISSPRARVGLVDEAKVDGSLHRCVRFVPSKKPEGATYVVKARSNSIRLILQEIACDSAVLDISRALGGRVQILSLRLSRKKRRGDGKD